MYDYNNKESLSCFIRFPGCLNNSRIEKIVISLLKIHLNARLEPHMWDIIFRFSKKGEEKFLCHFSPHI